MVKYIEAAKRSATNDWQNSWKQSERTLEEEPNQDQAPPTISLLAPDVTAENSVFRVDTYQTFIRGRVSDDSGVATVLVNGKRARVDEGGSFARKVKLALGTNAMTVQAEDIHGNVAERTFTIVREEFIPDDTLADVDLPPRTNMSNPDGIGLVIGVEGYQYVPAATYAYNDASTLEYPTVEDGARGVAWVAAALESDRAGGAWRDCSLSF